MVGYTKVVINTISQDIFNNLATFINAYKLNGWTVLASFPYSNPVYPCIVINPARAPFDFKTLDRSRKKMRISVEVEFFDTIGETKASIDNAKDNLRAMFLTHQSVLKSYGIMLDMDNPMDDNPSDAEEYNSQKLNTGSIELNLVLV